MNFDENISMLSMAFYQVLLVSGPILALALGIGLLIGIIQAATSINEMTLSFVPKVIVVMLGIGLLGNFFMMGLVDSVGDIPFEQANNPSEYPNPATSDDEVVYAGALALLDEASSYLSVAVAVTDIVFAGKFFLRYIVASGFLLTAMRLLLKADRSPAAVKD